MCRYSNFFRAIKVVDAVDIRQLALESSWNVIGLRGHLPFRILINCFLQCAEGFQWLAQEIRKSKGQALVIHVEQIDGLTDQQLVDLFRSARKEDYEEIETQAAALGKAIHEDADGEVPSQTYDTLARLQRQLADVDRPYT